MKLRICYVVNDSYTPSVVSITNLDVQRENLSWVPHVCDIVVQFNDGKFIIERAKSPTIDERVFLADLIQAYYDFLTKVKLETGG